MPGTARYTLQRSAPIGKHSPVLIWTPRCALVIELIKYQNTNSHLTEDHLIMQRINEPNRGDWSLIVLNSDLSLKWCSNCRSLRI
jgi:hypothetical protein